MQIQMQMQCKTNTIQYKYKYKYNTIQYKYSYHKATGLQRTATGWHHIAILAQGHRYRLHQVLESHIATTEKAAEIGPEVKNHGEKAAEVGPALSQESRSRGGTQKIATTGRPKTNPEPNEVPFGECQAIRALQKNDYS